MTLIPLNTGTNIISLGSTTVTSSGTPVRLTATSTPCKGVKFQADEGNNATIIAAGLSDVDAVSDPPVAYVMLYATQNDFIKTTDASNIYFDATANNGKVSWAIVG